MIGIAGEITPLLVKFPSSKAGLLTVGYTLKNTNGTVYAVRSTANVIDLGNGAYSVALTFLVEWAGSITWDTGEATPLYAIEEISIQAAPEGSTPASPDPGGIGVLSIDVVKSYLDVIHSADDVKLQMLLDGAEDEAMQFMNRSNLTEWDSDMMVDSEHLMPPSVIIGIVLLVQASYQAGVDEIEKLRKAAETKLTPYRLNMGV